MREELRAILETEFAIHECGDGSYELETWTKGGVNMIIHISATDEAVIEEFCDYADNFDVEEEIDLHRQCESYKNVFTIRMSLADFEAFEKRLEDIADKLRDVAYKEVA